ncbi:MAG TPA: squalene/phytoene synthase family protein [Rhizomicrobium sp.]|jgi:phytoene synthase
MDVFEACEAMVKAADPDRYVAALFAPAAGRKYLFALYAFNLEIARVAEAVRQPMLGEIRLQWWRETVEQAQQDRPREHDVARALAATFAEVDLPLALFDRMLEARIFDSSPESFETLDALETYADQTSGNLVRLAQAALGESNEDLAREAGLAYGLIGILRAIPFHAQRNKHFLGGSLLAQTVKERALAHLAAASRAARRSGMSVAALPAATVPLYAKALAKHPHAVALYRRQWAILRAATTGRFRTPPLDRSSP